MFKRRPIPIEIDPPLEDAVLDDPVAPYSDEHPQDEA